LAKRQWVNLKIWDVRKIKGLFLLTFLPRERKIATNNIGRLKKFTVQEKRETTVIKIRKLEGKQNFGSMFG